MPAAENTNLADDPGELVPERFRQSYRAGFNHKSK